MFAVTNTWTEPIEGKPMKKFVLFCVTMLIFHQYALAQSFFSLQWEIAEPTASFSEAAGTGFGIKGSYLHFVSQRIALTGSVGYIKWGPRKDVPLSTDYKFVTVPIQVGAKFLFTKGVVAPFVGIALGMDYVRVRGIAPNSTTNLYEDKSELKFGFSPSIGTAIHLFGPLGLNVAGSYNIIYTSDHASKYFGLNAGLIVGF